MSLTQKIFFKANLYFVQNLNFFWFEHHWLQISAFIRINLIF